MLQTVKKMKKIERSLQMYMMIDKENNISVKKIYIVKIEKENLLYYWNS